MAVVRAVTITHKHPIETPKMMLFAKRSKAQPHVVMRYYYPPAQFALTSTDQKPENSPRRRWSRQPGKSMSFG